MTVLNKKILIILIFLLIAMSSFIIWLYQYQQTTKQQTQEIKQKINNETEEIKTQVIDTTTTATSTLKIYHNAEFGFEFQYLEDWSFHEGTFYSPFSKFNLVGASPEENGLPNPISSPLLINIVTSDFADRAIMNRKNLGAIETNIIVGGVNGIKYEYTEDVVKISIDIPFSEYRIIIGAKKQYEDIFNQILSTFKFLK